MYGTQDLGGSAAAIFGGATGNSAATVFDRVSGDLAQSRPLLSPRDVTAWWSTRAMGSACSMGSTVWRYCGPGVRRYGPPVTRVVTVANLKGGSAKTTSAVYLAHEWHRAGHRVLVVDADPQGSALRWSELAGWPLPALGLPVRDLHRRLAGIVGDGYDLVVVDTPPMDEAGGIVHSALRAASDVVVPVAPTMVELDRLPPVWAAVADAGALADLPPAVSVLLTRTVPRASSTDVVRAAVVESGRRVLTATVPRRESYAQSYGGPVDPSEHYAAAAVEILTSEYVA